MAAAPKIFSPARRVLARRRMHRLQQAPDAPRYVLNDIVEDMIERLEFLRHAPRRALLIGDVHGGLAGWLGERGCEIVRTDLVPEPEASATDAEQPTGKPAPYDLVASLATLDTVNDLPGALVRMRRAMATNGLMLASFPGAGSLPALRAAMLAADGSRPAPRLHPQVEVRAAAALLQRCGFADPVADSRPLAVRFGSLERLVADLRAQALGNVLARPGPPLSRGALARARTAFTGEEVFEMVTLTGWNRPG